MSRIMGIEFGDRLCGKVSIGPLDGCPPWQVRVRVRVRVIFPSSPPHRPWVKWRTLDKINYSVKFWKID
jgi:hypothetical protein